MSEVLAAIDRLIDERLMPKRCRVSRGSCECGHIDMIHEKITKEPGEYRFRGLCRGRGCPCTWFTPKDYTREHEAMRRKYRAFALELLRELGGRS